ncbi:hypothetical protein KQI86_19180 [Clostridium sp. MSJ-11]|uniref:Uncharacterized protein n=1 Tax=Clostridium mobile TaxID=2841512 RepID=A0ABS6ENT2_9CLOT|nr:hypothetical protein [Clostridium mobile]MBU5486427.1 hypothetical protein [Clostridium mobile]
MEIKTLNIDGNEYLFLNLDQLIEILKDDDYEIKLDIKKKGNIRRVEVIL